MDIETQKQLMIADQLDKRHKAMSDNPLSKKSASRSGGSRAGGPRSVMEGGSEIGKSSRSYFINEDRSLNSSF